MLSPRCQPIARPTYTCLASAGWSRSREISCKTRNFSEHHRMSVVFLRWSQQLALMRLSRSCLREGYAATLVCGANDATHLHPPPSLSPVAPGMCLVIVGHPLDLIKVKLQTGGQYKGVADAAAKTLRSEGVSIWLGLVMPPPLVVGLNQTRW